MYRKHSFKEKLQIVLRYHSGVCIRQLSIEHCIGENFIRHWLGLFEYYGEDGLRKQPYRHFSSDFKAMVVRDFLEKGVSLFSLQIEHRLDRSTIQRWTAQVRRHGYKSLYITKKRGRKAMGRPKKKAPVSELEKL